MCRPLRNLENANTKSLHKRQIGRPLKSKTSETGDLDVMNRLQTCKRLTAISFLSFFFFYSYLVSLMARSPQLFFFLLWADSFLLAFYSVGADVSMCFAANFKLSTTFSKLREKDKDKLVDYLFLTYYIFYILYIHNI